MFIGLRVLGFNNGQKTGFPCRERGISAAFNLQGSAFSNKYPSGGIELCGSKLCLSSWTSWKEQMSEGLLFTQRRPQTKLKLGLKAVGHCVPRACRGDVAKHFGTQGVLWTPRTRENCSMHSWETMSVNRARETDWHKAFLCGNVEEKPPPYWCSSYPLPDSGDMLIWLVQG